MRVVLRLAGCRDPVLCRRRTAPGFVGGMRGKISANWSVFSGAAGFIWLVQCIGCRGESGHPHGWLATTRNGGASWSIELRNRFIPGSPVWAGNNGWTGSNGSGGGRFTATHDGGRTWTTVSVPRSPRLGFVSVADGVVWANASRCRAAYQCVYPVLRGPASGSRLTPVPTTPSDRGDLNIIAVSASSAYAFSPTGDAGARRSLGHRRRRAHLAKRRARLPGKRGTRSTPPSGMATARSGGPAHPPATPTRRWGSRPTAADAGSTVRCPPNSRRCTPSPRGSRGPRPCPARRYARPMAAARGTRSGPSTRISRSPRPAPVMARP